MGVIAVHRPTGVDTGDCWTQHDLDRAMAAAPVEGGEWITLFTRIPPSNGGYVGPENDWKWRRDHGVVWPDPVVDDQPVGVERI
jgi:hypothetical protein